MSSDRRLNWNERYQGEDLPWDTGKPDAHLVELVDAGVLTSCSVLEIGCGTGTNAIWLAQRGFTVSAFDISPVAIERARAKAEAAEVEVRFDVRDILEQGPSEDPSGATFDLVYDRGVFHVFDAPAQRARFAERVAQALAEQGRWLSLLGSTEGPARDYGPPRRSAYDIITAVEPVLELVSLRSTWFEANIPSPAMAWLMLARRRATPAQPSTVRA